MRVKCLVQCLARQGDCDYSHLQVFVLALDSKTYQKWVEATEETGYKRHPRRVCPRVGRAASGGSAPITGHRSAEVGWPPGDMLQRSGPHCDARTAAASPRSLLEMQILVLYPRSTRIRNWG